MMNIADVSSINDAMRMRDIRFGGKNAGKMIEYRMIPLLVCENRRRTQCGGDYKRPWRGCKTYKCLPDWVSYTGLCTYPGVRCAVSDMDPVHTEISRKVCMVFRVQE